MRQLLLFVYANETIDDYSSVTFFGVSSKIKFAKTVSLNYIFELYTKNISMLLYVLKKDLFHLNIFFL